jgi:hypothetical protein
MVLELLHDDEPQVWVNLGLAASVTEAVVCGELDDVGLWRRQFCLAYLMLAAKVEAPRAGRGGDERPASLL